MVEVGDKAPAFCLPSTDGLVSLKDFKGHTVVLYFYPKDMTSGCTQEACDFRDLAPRFRKKEAVILGISRDPVEKHERFAEKFSLNFPLLSDETGKVCEAYGVWKEKKLYGRKFMGIERSTFVINEKGLVTFAWRKVSVKEHATTVLKSL